MSDPRSVYETPSPLETRIPADQDREICQKITIEEAKARLRSPHEPPWGDLDPLIRPIVKVLWEEGVETYECCQGGLGHTYPEPAVRFYGGKGEGLRVMAVALAYNLHPTELRRFYTVQDGEIVGPDWEICFHIPGHEDWFDVSMKHRQKR
jgi:hypothetical protein